MNPGVGPFLALGHHLNNLGRGPLDNATYQISRLFGIVDSDKKIFKGFILEIYFKPV